MSVEDAEANAMVSDFPRGWIGFYDEDDDIGGCWYFCPKDYWEQFNCMPDCHDSPQVEGFKEIMEYCWKTNMSIEEATVKLKEIGLEIIENPIWYYDL